MMRRALSDDGFSLAETALSLSILALIIGAMVPGLLSARAAEQDRLTRSRLETVVRAVGAFVQANGCFPCPTPPSAQKGDGRGLVRGDTGPSTCNSCPKAVGLVPYRSLGIPESFARDGYNRWFTFAVDTALTDGQFAGIAPTAECKQVSNACTQDDIDNKRQKEGLCKAGLPVTSRLSVITRGSQAGASPVPQPAAIVILSHGANGYGAYNDADTPVHFPFPDTDTCSAGNSGGEHCNADAENTLQFVASQQAAFDDQMLYFNRDALIAMLGNGTCKGD